MSNGYNVVPANKSLFRAKRKDNNEWLYWNIYGELCRISGKRTRLAITKGAGTSYYDYIHQVSNLINKNTIGRFSGANDKDGTRIFEGDIIRGEKSETYFAIKFLDRDFAPVFDCVPPVPLCEGYGLVYLLATEGCTIAGDIYDNYELLGGLADDSTKWVQMFNRFLETVEFVLIKYGDNRWGLVDSTGTNLANIEEERFCSATGIAERLDNYISDYFISDIDNALEEKGVEVNWHNSLEAYLDNAKELLPDFASDFEIIDMLCNHTEEINLNDCRYEEREEYLKENIV